jgi:hypothetical protein
LREKLKLEGSEKFRAALIHTVSCGTGPAGGDTDSGGGAEAAGVEDHPVDGVGVERFIGAEAHAVEGEVGDDDVVIGAAGAGFGGEPGIGHEGLPLAAAAVGGYLGWLEDRGLRRVHVGGIHIGFVG